MTNRANGVPATQPGNRKVIPATCITHGDARGFTNLVVSRVDTIDGVIELDPHAIGCVLRLDEGAASVLRDLLTEWLR